MNEFKLSLQNFQSISEGELIFKTGLNFIVGQSNSGKSATFRAIKACLLNPKGSQRFIKKGHNKSVVTLSYNGNSIEWDRTSKESSYVINGEEYIKTGSSDSFKILENNTGFVRDEKEGALMNIEEELQLPFPFGVSKSELFKLFENVFCVSDSAIILKSAKEHEDNVKDKISSLEIDRAKLNTKISSLQDFKEEIDLQILRNFKQFAEEKQSRLTILNDGLREIKLAKRIVDHNLEVEEKNFYDLYSPYQVALDCKKTLIKLRELHNLNKSLQELSVDTSSKLGTYKTLLNLKNDIETLKKIKGLALQEKDFISRLEDYNRLTSLNDTLQKLKKLNKLKVSEEKFKNRLQRLLELKEIKAFVEKINNEIEILRVNKKREKENALSIEAKLKEFKVCPLCHHSLEN